MKKITQRVRAAVSWIAGRFRRRKLTPDVLAFNMALIRSVNLQNHGSDQVAKDFRRLFLRDPDLGKRVLFILLKWCGEYEVTIDDENPVPPLDRDLLQRWAGKQEIAGNIKAALYADLTPPQTKGNFDAES